MNLVIRISQTSRCEYRACCPALPGCVVWGRTRQEAEDRIRQAVLGYLSSLDVAMPRELASLLHVS
jgi:predicted RNase H-like HicB family nuclease